MSNISNTTTRLPAEGPKHNVLESHPVRKEKYGQKGQVDNLPTHSQPGPSETLDVGPPTSIAHKFLIIIFI